MSVVNHLQTFEYTEAFRRNLGFISPDEQERLKKAKIAIAGLGGAGGAQVLALVRMGVGNFAFADPDTFEQTNMNRQLGATLQTLGRRKVDVWREMTVAVNAEAQVELFDQGVTEHTIEPFLKAADGVVDALDFSCFKERKLLYQKAREKNLWIINVAPTGFGATLLLFDPKGMTFEKYFGIREGMSFEDKSFAMAYGLNPAPFLLKYLDKRAVDLKKGQMPCVSPGFFICAGMGASEAANLILNKQPRRPVPWVFQYDALLHEFRKKRYPAGMDSPWHRFKKGLIRKFLKS